MIRSLLSAAGVATLVTTALIAYSPRSAPEAGSHEPAARVQPESPPRSDALAQLLSEVHELRLVLQRQGTDSARIQLLISRLSIQETRVTRLGRDLDDVREQLTRVDEEQRQRAARLKQMESALAQPSDAAEKSEIEQQVAMMRREQRDTEAREQRMRGRESELDAAYAAEQARWVEISNRLDELERSLGRP